MDTIKHTKEEENLIEAMKLCIALDAGCSWYAEKWTEYKKMIVDRLGEEAGYKVINIIGDMFVEYINKKKGERENMNECESCDKKISEEKTCYAEDNNGFGILCEDCNDYREDSNNVEFDYNENGDQIVGYSE